MKSNNILWKTRLQGKLPATLKEEIDIFEREIELIKVGKVDEKIFGETRLRKGAYGQRYDNGKRHDGIKERVLNFPNKDLFKGPGTYWDAPGMLRIKNPYGGLTPDQMEELSDLAEEYSDGILHVTTRQEFQLHFVHIDDTPTILRRLASVGITTREACGNSVRNITTCPIAGVCRDEPFDVTPHSKALTNFLLGHNDIQDFGRKFKITFSGCPQHGCGLGKMHEIGFIAKLKGKERGFEFHVGGGLGPVPFQAQLFDEFLPEKELLPMSQAVCRVFARLGEKKNRSQARLKFLVAKVGMDEFKKLVYAERKILIEDKRWTDYLTDLDGYYSESPKEISIKKENKKIAGLESFTRENLYFQKQKGYVVVKINLPLGDLTAHQLRRLSDLSAEYGPGTVRMTPSQDIMLRWIPEDAVPNLYIKLREIGLGAAGGNAISNIVSCPGTDTCKLGISSSRGLAAELLRQFNSGDIAVDDVIHDLKIKISGCFNSCSQHHLADLGFFGVHRKKGNHRVAHFQVVLGGLWSNNGGEYGLPIVAIPSKNIPEVVKRVTTLFKNEKEPEESFNEFVKRTGRVKIKKELTDLAEIPDFEKDQSYYSDWGDTRLYTTGDMGIGECAGEVISMVDFDLHSAERELFDGQIAHEDGDFQKAGDLAFAAMVHGAKALVKTFDQDISDDWKIIHQAFKKKLYDTEVFFDPYAKGKFAGYFFDALKEMPKKFDDPSAKKMITESGLFIEACHACYLRMDENK